MPGVQDYETFEEAAPSAPPPAVTRQPATLGGGDTTKIDPKTGKPTITVFPRPPARTGTDAYETFDSGDVAGTSSPVYREMGAPEAAARGYIDWSTMGLGPALMGAGAAGAAGKTPEQQQAEIQPGTEYPGGEMVGEGLHRAWAGHPAYEQGRESFLNDDRMAQDQHFAPYVFGQIAGALSAPGTIAGNMMRTGLTKFLPRLAQTIVHAATRTGAQSAGEAVSEGRPEDAPVEAAKGAASGAILSGAGSIGAEVVGGVGRKVAAIVRGARETTRDAEAGRKAVDALTADISRFGATTTPEEKAVAQAAGTPMAPVDIGGEQTRKLFRSAANLSPEGRQVAQDFTQQRFRGQGSRAANFTRDLMGVGGSTRDQDVIDAAKAAFNPPMYKRAYQAGDRPIRVSDALLGDPDVSDAIGKAARTGKSWAVIDGMGGFNPSVTITDDGRLIFNKGPTGVPTYPNIQFWDYAQRELSGAIDSAKRANKTSDVNRLTQLRRMMLKELDDQVPEFGQARATASNFFGAENAVEAGDNFVMMPGRDLAEAARALGGMKPVERELFARSFASNLASKFEDIRYNADALNQAFIESPTARAKINLALGKDRADQLEAFLRVENVADRARKALGNSTTVRQAHELEAAGGAVGAAEGLKNMTMTGMVLSGLGIVKGRKMLAGIDEKVAQRVVEMLVNPDELQKGIQLISKSPTWMRVLRQATGVSARVAAQGLPVAAQDIGFPNIAGSAMVAAEDIRDIFKKEHEKEPHHEMETQQYQDQAQ